MEDTRTKSTVLIDDIKPDQNQPRKQFTEKHISELATSILTEGFIQPIECDSEMKMPSGARMSKTDSTISLIFSIWANTFVAVTIFA